MHGAIVAAWYRQGWLARVSGCACQRNVIVIPGGRLRDDLDGLERAGGEKGGGGGGI